MKKNNLIKKKAAEAAFFVCQKGLGVKMKQVRKFKINN